MGFYHILHNNSLGHLLRTSRDSVRPPPPQSFRKEMDNIWLYFLVHFRGVFVVFVVDWLALHLKFGSVYFQQFGGISRPHVDQLQI